MAGRLKIYIGNVPIPVPFSYTPNDAAGVVKEWAGLGTKVPIGYLLCDGGQVSRITYVSLFAAITVASVGVVTSGSNSISSVTNINDIQVGWPISGPGIPAGATVASVNTGTSVITISANATASNASAPLTIAPWGVGDGATTFNVPDMRVRTPVGAGTGRILGSTDGIAESSRNASFAHSHTHGGSGSGSTSSDGSHSHSVTIGSSGSLSMSGGTGIDGSHDHGSTGGPSGTGNNFATTGSGSAAGPTHSHSVGSSGSAHQHSVSVSGGSHGHSGSSDTAAAHSHSVSVSISTSSGGVGNHPSAALNYIIKT